MMPSRMSAAAALLDDAGIWRVAPDGSGGSGPVLLEICRSASLCVCMPRFLGVWERAFAH